MSKSREQVQGFLKKIDISGKTVLDVGAGRKKHHAINWLRGDPLIYNTCDVVKYKDVDFKCDLDDFGARQFQRQNEKYQCKWDYVFCIEVLEHVLNPILAIHNLSNFTKEKLFITAPFINPYHDTHDYLRYTSQWFDSVLPKYGFKDVKITQREATVGRELLDMFYQIEGLRMSKVTRRAGYSNYYYNIGLIVEATKREK